MSPIANPRITAITGDDLTAESLSSLNRRVSSLERSGGGGITLIGGSSSGSVPDATTVVKGKLALAGDLSGTADTPTISVTATPTIAALSVNAPSAGGAAFTTYKDATVSKWKHGKETNDTYRIIRTGGYSNSLAAAEAAAFNLSTIAFEARPVFGDGNFFNRLKIWATPNDSLGNSALDISGYLDASKQMAIYGFPANSNLYRFGCALDSLRNGTNGSRGESTLLDGAAANDASHWNAIQQSTTQDGRGSFQSYWSKIDVQPERTGLSDSYCEAYGFDYYAGVSRKGALVGCEAGIFVNSPTEGYNISAGTYYSGTNDLRYGPARVNGWSAIIADFNPYSSYHPGYFGVGSPWIRSGVRPFWAHAAGTAGGGAVSKRVGTAFYAAGSHAYGTGDTQEFERLFVGNVGSSSNVPGVDVFTIRGDGSLFVGDNVGSALYGGSVAAVAINKSATAPTIQVMQTAGFSAFEAYQVGDAQSRTALTAGSRLDLGNGHAARVVSLYLSPPITSSSVALNAPIASSGTPDPIPYLGSGVAFPNSGYFMVGAEMFSYASKTATTFTGIARAVGGTTAIAHLSGDFIYNVSNTLKTDNNFVVGGNLTAGSITGGGSGGGGVFLEVGSAPAAVTDTAILFARDNGSNRTQLCLQMPTGAVIVLATEA